MFGIVRRKSNSQLVRQELGQSVEHLKQAANHAARGTGATVGPKFYAARDRVQPAAGRVKDVASTGWGSAVATVSAAGDTIRKADRDTRQSAKDARKTTNKNQKKLQKKTAKAMSKKQSGGKKSKLTSLLVAGAAVGAAGAYFMRKRNSQKWDEYDPSRPVSSTEQLGTGAIASEDVVFEPAEPAGTAAFTPPVTGTETGTGTFAEPTTPAVGGDREDQTSSSLHSPNVARMAGGSTQT